MFRLPRPQKNYTEIPNVVFDELFPRISNFAALKCYLLMIRKTWGFAKTGDYISISQLIKLTGLSRQSCITGMKWLEDNGYIWTSTTGENGAMKKMYFLCSEETEEIEIMVKGGIISADKLFKMMMEERKRPV